MTDSKLVEAIRLVEIDTDARTKKLMANITTPNADGTTQERASQLLMYGSVSTTCKLILAVYDNLVKEDDAAAPNAGMKPEDYFEDENAHG